MKEHLRPGRPRKIRPIEDVLIKATEAVASMPSITNPPVPDAMAIECLPQKAAFEPHSVIQVRVEPNRGSLWQVGELEGNTVHCYRLMGEGVREHGSFKVDDVTLISNVKAGMVAAKYVRPEEAPDWHRDET